MTHVNLLYTLGLDASLGEGGLDGSDTELGGRDGGEGTILRADGGALGAEDVDGLGGLGVSTKRPEDGKE